MRWRCCGRCPVPEAAVHGFLIGLSLILAIGAQNAFVLRQGLRREHVGAVVLVCAVSDAVLIAAGVAGFGLLAARVPWLEPVMLWAGVAFLTVYGVQRLRQAAAGGAALVPQGAGATLSRTVATALLFTWANPHVYLDTLVLIGAVSAQYAPQETAFALGAMTASATFFASLGYGARLLAPVFARPAAWVRLEAGVGVTMLALAAMLAWR
ncbi:MAG: LysE/ArgO family amino acid transporter [Gemmobacter sp.]